MAEATAQLGAARQRLADMAQQLADMEAIFPHRLAESSAEGRPASSTEATGADEP